jgi:hypothetical protein
MSKKRTIQNVLGHTVNAKWHINPDGTEVLVPEATKIGKNVHIGKGVLFDCHTFIPDDTIIGSYREVQSFCSDKEEEASIQLAYNRYSEHPCMDDGGAAWALYA